MGGSGGGGGYGGGSFGLPDDGSAEAEAKKRLAEQQLRAELNDVLDGLLQEFNDRDAEQTTERLDALVDAIGDSVELDRLLFGGSVAKHTYVDGLSDVDALLVLKESSGGSPAEMVEHVAELIANQGLQGVAKVEAGAMAVTITYADGSEVQLLPAQESDGKLSVAGSDGTSWREIAPKRFAQKLTEVNQATNGMVVPTIKLAKAVLQQLPSSQALSGYHVECLAVDAFKNYSGSLNWVSVLNHLLNHASEAVLSPTADITGQSVHVDAWLGSAGSSQRRAVSSSIRHIVGAMESAQSADAYRAALDV